MPNKASLGVLTVSLIALTISGYLILTAYDIDKDKDKTPEDLVADVIKDRYADFGYAEHAATDHQSIEVDPDLPTPQVDIEISQDAKSGYNIHVITKNFTFTPENASDGTAPANEGHAHLVINGYVINRIYSDYYHIKPNILNTGQNTIVVSLNANNHADWTLDGVAIADQEIINN